MLYFFLLLYFSYACFFLLFSESPKSSQATETYSDDSEAPTMFTHTSQDSNNNVNNNPSQLNLPSYTIPLRSALSCVSYIGILGNTFAFFVLTREAHKEQEQPGTIFLRALVLTDALYLLFMEAFWTYLVIYINTPLCIISVLLVHVVSFYSKYVLVLLNVDRFMAIFFPIKWKIVAGGEKARKVSLLILFLIISGISVYYSCTFQLVDSAYRPCNNLLHSTNKFLDWLMLMLNTVAAVTIAFCSGAICVKLWRSSKKKGDMVDKETQKKNNAQVL